MFKRFGRLICFLLAVFIVVSVGSVSAIWRYPSISISDEICEIPVSLEEFAYGMFYITKVKTTDGVYSSAQFAKVGDVDVASFTKLPESTVWTDLVPLTKGTASANNYSGYGSANSFNTDTWVSDDGKTIKQLAQSPLKLK